MKSRNSHNYQATRTPFNILNITGRLRRGLTVALASLFVCFGLLDFRAFSANQGTKSNSEDGDQVLKPEEDNASPKNPARANTEDYSRMSSREYKLSLIILVFGLLVLAAEFLLLRTVSCNAEQLLRIFGITLIVIGALIIIPAGFSNDTIAPAMGLLGTIAGYLLSQRDGNGSKRTENGKDL
jgi:hypothetical protein